MTRTQYKFENCDGDKFPEVYNSIKEAVKDCSDYKTYRKADGGYYTKENGFISEVER
jgi:hypothetical protein